MCTSYILGNKLYALYNLLKSVLIWPIVICNFGKQTTQAEMLVY